MLGLIIGAVASLAIGFSGGWVIKDWKDGAVVALAVSDKERVESRNAILEAANSSCATDIEGVKSALGVITQGVEEREKAASAAMAQAKLKAAKHSTQAKAIKELPSVPSEVEAQCAAIVREQREYALARTQSVRK